MEITPDIALRIRRAHILTRASFAMLLVLFLGLGTLLWQSIALVNDLQQKLDDTRATVAQLRERIQILDADGLSERLVTRVGERITRQVAAAVAGSDLDDSLREFTGELRQTREGLADTGDAIRRIGDSVGSLDTDALAQRISYHLLRGIGEGFTSAAEKRAPE